MKITNIVYKLYEINMEIFIIKFKIQIYSMPIFISFISEYSFFKNKRWNFYIIYILFLWINNLKSN
jgi:hypothetical protein